MRRTTEWQPWNGCRGPRADERRSDNLREGVQHILRLLNEMKYDVEQQRLKVEKEDEKGQ